jgi:hypothetical protein
MVGGKLLVAGTIGGIAVMGLDWVAARAILEPLGAWTPAIVEGLLEVERGAIPVIQERCASGRD